MNISVKAFENADPDSAVKAHVNMTIDNAFVVKNLAVVEGKNGLSVINPRPYGLRPKYHNDAYKTSLRDNLQ